MATPDQLNLPRHIGPYHILRRLGRGGMAEVYLAETVDRDGGAFRVALKVLLERLARDENFVSMLLDEAEVVVQLDHPNIVRAYELGRVGNAYYLSMEYVPGLDLFHLMTALGQSGGELPWEAALYVGRMMLRGLGYAHHLQNEHGHPLGLVHRDVSPQNILVSRDGAVKVTDFGIAKVTSSASRTAIGVIKGKLEYMSPEQARALPLDRRADVFSAGVVLFEALTNSSLYPAWPAAKMLRRVQSPSVPAPSERRPELPTEIDLLVERAVAADKEQRYPDAAAFEQEIAEVMQRLAPGYGRQQVAELVEGALAAERARGDEVAGAASGGGSRPLSRRLFVTHEATVVVGGFSVLREGEGDPTRIKTASSKPVVDPLATDVDRTDAQLDDEPPTNPERGPVRSAAMSQRDDEEDEAPTILRDPLMSAMADHDVPLASGLDVQGSSPMSREDRGDTLDDGDSATTLRGDAAGGAPPERIQRGRGSGIEETSTSELDEPSTVALAARPEASHPPVHQAETHIASNSGSRSRPGVERHPGVERSVESAEPYFDRSVSSARLSSRPVIVRRGFGGVALLVVALVALVGGGAAVVLAHHLDLLPAFLHKPAQERAVRWTAGEPIRVGRWICALQSVDVVRSPATSQLLLRLRLTRAGHPAAYGSRFFFLQRARGYRDPVVLPDKGGHGRVELTFSLPEGSDGPKHVVRFAPPDAPSVLLEVRAR